MQFDRRDKPRGPRSGGNYYIHYTHYSDRSLHEHSYQQLETALEQYIPYFNKTRVIALRIGTNMTYEYNGQTVPFYLQAKLGGNDLLRGFARFRFADANSVLTDCRTPLVCNLRTPRGPVCRGRQSCAARYFAEPRAPGIRWGDWAAIYRAGQCVHAHR